MRNRLRERLIELQSRWAMKVLQSRTRQAAAAHADGETTELVRFFQALLQQLLPPSATALLPSATRREAPVASTWVHQNEQETWDIPKDARVLDLGSGGFPFSRATHLIDRFPGETTHRVGAAVIDERPFIIGDLHRLPFRDQSFDFTFCSHVLEHLDRPGDAIRELMRISPRGYVEVPTRLSDIMFNFTRLEGHHRWHALLQGDCLLFVEWTARERRELGNTFFDALHSTHLNAFQEFFERNRDLFFVGKRWQGVCRFRVMSHEGQVIDES